MAQQLIKRGEIYWVNLPDSNGRELKEIHPCLVISNDRQNFASPLITIIPITSLKAGDKIYSFQVSITLQKKSILLIHQIQTIDRDKFKDKITEIEDKLLEEVERKIHFVLALRN
jgi:mRNA interferase MazF